MASLLWAIIFAGINICICFNNIQAMDRMRFPSVKDKQAVYSKELFEKRRSVRAFQNKPASLDQLSHFWMASCGFRKDRRSITSSGVGPYSLDLYVAGGAGTEGMDGELWPGIYRYLPQAHELTLVRSGDKRKEVTKRSVLNVDGQGSAHDRYNRRTWQNYRQAWRARCQIFSHGSRKHTAKYLFSSGDSGAMVRYRGSIQ